MQSNMEKHDACYTEHFGPLKHLECVVRPTQATSGVVGQACIFCAFTLRRSHSQAGPRPDDHLHQLNQYFHAALSEHFRCENGRPRNQHFGQGTWQAVRRRQDCRRILWKCRRLYKCICVDIFFKLWVSCVSQREHSGSCLRGAASKVRLRLRKLRVIQAKLGGQVRSFTLQLRAWNEVMPLASSGISLQTVGVRVRKPLRMRFALFWSVEGDIKCRHLLLRQRTMGITSRTDNKSCRLSGCILPLLRREFLQPFLQP